MMDLNGILLCACGAAYAINPQTGAYTPDTFYEPQVGYANTPVAVAAASQPGAPYINACLVGATADAIIVAFRGTLFGETEASFDDWLQDFFAETVAVNGLPGKVHDGFYSAVNSIYSQIVAQVMALQGGGSMPIYVTGHSKGGAMAPIFAYMMYHSENLSASQVVTFAAPRSGDVDFANGYNTVYPNHMRFENYGDLVPLLPPSQDFDTALADIASYFSSDLAGWIADAAKWNYAAVGAESFIAENDEGQYEIYTDELILEQVTDVGTNLYEGGIDNVETTLLDAHTISCGFGYMTGVCGPMTCPAASADVARPAAVGRVSA